MSASVNGVNPKPGPAVSQNGPNSVSKPKDVKGPDPEIPDEDPQSSVAETTQMGIKFAKTFLLIFPIYVLGYLEFSFSWVLIGLAALFWLKRNRGERFARVNQALAFMEQEDRTVRQNLQSSDLPPWVHFPDVERVEWLNKTVQQMWPYICQFVEKLFRETIEPAVQGAHAQLSTFTFTKIDMGDKPLRVDGVKVYTENVDRRQIIMDLQINFVGNTEIDVDIKKYYCRAGIKSIQLNGLLRVIMDPLLGDMPLIGALSVFFLKKPFLDINWTGLTNMLDVPGINGLSDGIIQDIIYSYLVLPNKLNIPLIDKAHIDKLRFPMPKAVLRIHFLEAQDLLGKDKFLGGLIKGKSDPYGVIQLGNQLFRSKVIKETVNPKWNEVYEAFVYDQPDQNLDIELYDEDPDKDDFLGSITIKIDELEKEQKVDEWFVLDDVSTGKLHLKLQWLSLLSTPDKLDEVLSSVKADKGQANDGLSSALLLVHLDSAKNLPTGKKVTSEPCPFVQLTVGHKSFESKTRFKTTEPVWEEAHTFLIHNPKSQDLEVEVKDEKRECSMGTISFPLSKLLQEETMMITERFPLKNSGPGASLKLKMALRILCMENLTGSDQPTSQPSAQPSSVQVRRSSASVAPSSSTQRPSVAAPTQTSKSPPTPTPRTVPSTPTPSSRVEPQTDRALLEDSPARLTKSGQSASNLAISGSQLHLNSKEPTPSIASDVSNPSTALELQRTIQMLHNGSSPGFAPLGEIQLTIRHSPQRNKLIVVVHGCRNLISSTESGSDPYVRLYLLPDKRRSGRRKTNTLKKTVNPIYDQTFEFSVSLVELHRRTLDVAVKNGGGILSKSRGLLGKVLVDSEDISRSTTQWYELTVDGQKRQSQYP
ncbi:extended synaptotagmin-2 isoform X3 [Misgurnus anguillicaudatus]|uniref:extended synaptotagmin-2 isoform X3 n=1 Tax=Misgurnus anguillicaudatus TaxID=75329 RepID=UPI0024352C22|nr:extended synaptotagmin-2 isoform X3 [Misgurnus anguillicaudatus]